MKGKLYTPLATAAGGLLAMMIFLNGILSRFTNPFFSSFIVHIAGLVSSFLIWVILVRVQKGSLVSREAPLWSYLGGFVGALSVVTSNAAVNSPLGLAGSLSCFILGQTLTALAIDRFGLFGASRRNLTLLDGVRVVSILAGSLMMINAGGRA